MTWQNARPDPTARTRQESSLTNAICPVIQYPVTETTMKDSETIRFEDVATAEEATAIVRYDDQNVAVCLSHKTDGDIEVLMRKEDARKLRAALIQATT